MSNSAYVNSVLADHFIAIRDELDHADTIELMADVVRQLTIPGVKTISVIGGAASGKSTVAEELAKCLSKSSLRTDILSTDNYVVGDRNYRQVKLKDADAQKKYDFVLMDEHIRSIRQLTDDSQAIIVPVINPETGIALDEDDMEHTHKIGKLDVLIIEGDFPRDDYDLRFYIHVSDAKRLENNLEREAEQHDDIDEAKLTASFNDRQRTLHKPYTLPALQSADYVLVTQANGSDWTFKMYQRN